MLEELQALFRDRLAAGGPETQRYASAILEVDAARGMAERNLNPQLIVAGLLGRLNIVLMGTGDAPRGPGGNRNPAGPITVSKG